MTPQERAAAALLDEFLRPGIEAQFIRDCCVDRPYKLPRPRPSKPLSKADIDLLRQLRNDT